MQFQGDPRIRILGYGAEVEFKDGQPEMDTTIENEIVIRLFTKNGWVGNMFARADKNLIGSDFEDLHERPLTATLLVDIRSAAVSALEPMLTSGKLVDMDVYVSNPDGNNIYTIVATKDKDGIEHNFKISRTAGRWIVQRILASAEG